MYFILTALIAAAGFTTDHEENTTIVFPPYGHCMGIYRAGQDQLTLLLGGMLQFDDPQGLAAVLPDEWDSSDPGDDDELAVYGVNSGSGHIIYNASMYALGYYGGEGSDSDQLSSPHGIAATTSGTIYVADTGNHRVAVLSRTGQRITPGSFIEGLSEPWDVALDGRYIWVTDRAAGTLSRYSSAADPAPVVVNLDSPGGVAATGYGEYSNGHSPCQVVVTHNGTLLEKLIDGSVVETADLSSCGGSYFNYVELDYHGNAWVTDSIACRIHKFDPELNYLDSWGNGYGENDGSFMHPTGLAIWDRFGQIFVAESSGARYFWVGSDIRNLSFSSDGSECTVSGRLTEKAAMVVNIYRSDGTLARSLYSGHRAPGNFSFEWDGTTLQGQRVYVGEYTLSINIEPVYSSRTYFDKTFLRDFHMDGPEKVEVDPGVRAR
jgi:DNA-binding beta-propeller fold protein YncE